MRFFNRFNFETPENVELEFTLAGIGSRAFALSIDYSILLVVLTIYIFALIFISAFFLDFTKLVSRNIANLEIWLAALAILIFFVIYTGYFVFFETLWQGQTPGKRWAKIRVIRDDGRIVGLQQATLRSLLRPIDDLFFIGAFLIIFNRQEKRLGDWVAGTLVIQEETATSSSIFSLSEEAKILAKQLITDGDFSRLSSEDFAVIREYLHRRSGMMLEAQHQLSRQLAYQIKDIIQLEEIPEKVTANIFLEAVYLAYKKQFSPEK